MKKMANKEDFEWYKKRIDAESRYEHRHNGIPEKYPCVVSSEFWDDPNGPYTYDHAFVYEEEQCCTECGHKTKRFPITKEEESQMYDD